MVFLQLGWLGRFRKPALHLPSCFQILQETGRVLGEAAVLGVNGPQPAHLVENRRDFGLGVGVVAPISECSSFKAVEVKEHIPDVSRRIVSSALQPLQIRCPRVRRSIAVVRPIGQLAHMAVGCRAIDSLCWIDQCRFRHLSMHRLEIAADIDQTAQENVAADLGLSSGGHPAIRCLFSHPRRGAGSIPAADLNIDSEPRHPGN